MAESSKHSKYMEFLKSKMAIAKDTGFEISAYELNPALLPHQRDIVAWAIKGGRRAIFAKFGLGKTVMETEFCRKVIDKIGGKALIILPLGVKQEFTRDAVEILGYEAPEYALDLCRKERADMDIKVTNLKTIRVHIITKNLTLFSKKWRKRYDRRTIPLSCQNRSATSRRRKRQTDTSGQIRSV